MLYEYGKPARITLTVTDPTTQAYVNPSPTPVLTVTKPDGTTATPAVTNPSTGSFYGDQVLTQATPPIIPSDWRYVWKSGTTVLDEGALVVMPTGYLPAWTPSLDTVASYVPMRTIELGNLTGTPSGTFTALTMPTAVQVEGYAQDGANRVLAATGTLSASLDGLANSVAAMWAASLVELAQPSDQQDARRFQQLREQFDLDLAALVERNEVLTGVGADGTGLPVYAYPDPVSWGDQLVVFG